MADIDGRTRTYFVKEGKQSSLVTPKQIPGTELYVESNFSANDVNRVQERVLTKFGHSSNDFEIFTEESSSESSGQ